MLSGRVCEYVKPCHMSLAAYTVECHMYSNQYTVLQLKTTRLIE